MPPKRAHSCALVSHLVTLFGKFLEILEGRDSLEEASLFIYYLLMWILLAVSFLLLAPCLPHHNGMYHLQNKPSFLHSLLWGILPKQQERKRIHKANNNICVIQSKIFLCFNFCINTNQLHELRKGTRNTDT